MTERVAQYLMWGPLPVVVGGIQPYPVQLVGVHRHGFPDTLFFNITEGSEAEGLVFIREVSLHEAGEMLPSPDIDSGEGVGGGGDGGRPLDEGSDAPFV